MDHLAIMHKKFLDKIIAGTKIIESRWTVTKRAPYGKVKSGDTIYFKLSGGLVTTTAQISDAKYFDLAHISKKELYDKYGKSIGFTDLKELLAYTKGKRYCSLLFLKNVKEMEPFTIDKAGYGNANAWIIIEDITHIRKT